MRRQCNSGGICVISLHQFGFRLLWLRRSPGDWLGAMAVTCTHLWTGSLSGSCSASSCPWRHDQREVGGCVGLATTRTDYRSMRWRLTQLYDVNGGSNCDVCWRLLSCRARGSPYCTRETIWQRGRYMLLYPLRSLHARGHNIALVYARFIVITTIIHEKLLMRGLYVTAVVWRHVTCFIIKVYLSLNWHHDVT